MTRTIREEDSDMDRGEVGVGNEVKIGTGIHE